jgi:hypothetical protein
MPTTPSKMHEVVEKSNARYIEIKMVILTKVFICLVVSLLLYQKYFKMKIAAIILR